MDFVITESSYKADRFSIGCLLTDKGKVRCQNLSKKSSPTNQTDVLDNIPPEIAEELIIISKHKIWLIPGLSP